MFLLIAAAAAAPLSECPRTYVTGDLVDALDSAERSFARQDEAGFVAGATTARERLACVRDPLVPDVLARAHLVEALGAFLANDEAGVRVALAGMAAADPGHQIPGSLVPEGHPIRDALRGAGLLLREPDAAPLVPMEVGWFEVDGVSATAVPSSRSAVVQRFDSDGAVTETRYLRPGADLEDWAPLTSAPATPIPGARPSAGVRVAPRVSAAALAGGLTTPGDSTRPDGFAAGGLLLGVGAEVGGDRLGGFGEVAWTSAFGPGPEGADPRQWHGGLVAAGPQVRLGALTVEAGPAWMVLSSLVTAPTCSGGPCDAPGDATGRLMAGGVVLGTDLRLGDASSLLAVEARGGVVTDLTRELAWGGVGVRLGRRWSGR